jgi:DNA repair protein RecO (recombination protein O)
MNELVPAFVLHARDYRDTSLLIEFLTPEQGRINAIAKGARRIQRGTSQRAILQPLQPLWIECGGRGELKSLHNVEVRAPVIGLRGHALFSAFYLNELLCRLLHRDDPHPQLFADYAVTLEQLGSELPLDITLRHFELRLLDEMGYGLDLMHEGVSGDALQRDWRYTFDAQRGLVLSKSQYGQVFLGADLLDFSAGEFTDAARRAVKNLCRLALQVHLGSRPLQSRALFMT